MTALSKYDPTRPSLILMRFLLTVLTLSYLLIRIFQVDASGPFFGIARQDPLIEQLPYSTNTIWANFMLAVSFLLIVYTLVHTLLITIWEYKEFKQFGLRQTPWSIIFAMVFLSASGYYYMLVAILVVGDIRVLWPAMIATMFTTLTYYEIRQHDSVEVS